MIPSTEALVVDASVAVKWHLTDEDNADQATQLLSRFAQGQTDLLAPVQIRYEVPSAITVATRGRARRITQEQGREAIEEFLALGLTTIDTDALILAAYPLVDRHGCAFYDALYLALAETLSLRFITADHKLYQRVRHLSYVVWLGDYTPPSTEGASS